MKPQDLGIGKLFESVREATIVADATTGRIVLWNPAATEIFGYSSSEALGMNVEDLVPSHLKERHRAGISRYRDTGHGPYIDSNTVLDLPAVRKTGEEICVELTLSPIEPTRDSEARDRFVLAILRDVTERKRAEEEVRRLNEQLEERVAQRTAQLEAALAELRDSEERYRLLVEGAQDYAIFMLDPEGRVATWNEGAERLFGYQEEEIIGKPDSLLFMPEDIRSGAPERERGKAAEEGRAVDDRWHVRKDGSQFWASGFVRPVRDEAGNLRGFAKVARDITEHKKVEDKLRESEERFRATFEQAAVGVAHVSTDGQLLRVNDKLCEIFGYTPEEMLGLTLQDLAYPEDHGADLEQVRRVLAGKTESYSMEKRYFRKDGSLVWANLAVSLVRDPLGDPEYFIGAIEDITERKRAEEALKESEERFRVTFEQAAVGVAHVGPNGRWLRVNNKLCEITGYPREELLGMTFQDITHPDDLQKDLDHLHRLLAGEIRTYSTEKRYLRKDRSVVWINLTVSVVGDSSGRPKYFITVIEDIGERKKAEEALSQSEERYRAVVEQSAEGLYLVDGDTKRILETNPALQNMLGYTADELRGMELHEIVAHDREDVYANVERTLREGWRFIRERRYRRKDGSVVEVEVAASTINYGGKQVICAAIRDITERKRAEEEIRLLNEQLEQRVRQRTAQLEEANRELESFSYSVSHDLRAPIRHIGGFAQMLKQRAEPSLDETSLRYLNTIVQSTDRAGTLIDDLLSFSRMTRAQMWPSVVDMNRFLREVLSDLSFETNGREVDWRIGELSEVRGDPSMLRLVLQNLLSNALKYTRPRDRAVIEVGSTEGEGEVVFWVRDNGVGFDQAYTDKLFGVFQRLHGSEEFEGTGIGLATVARIVHRHGGRVWAEGRVGEGATFYFSLPLPREPDNES